MLFALFQLKFAIITPALITGSFAERVRFSSYLLFMCCSACSFTARWRTGRGIRRASSASGACWISPAARSCTCRPDSPRSPARSCWAARTSTATRSRTCRPTSRSCILGTGMLWFGWFGFNAGSALAANGQAVMAFATTNTASAAAALAWMAFDVMRGRQPSAIGACVGAVVGLVAITPAAGYVSIGASILIGTVASTISNAVVHLKSKSTLDDTLDVFPCHGVGGMVGMIATGVFAREVGLIVR